ncbi:Cullin protein neddylation domain containing protein, putative [Angomonas deanei]|uniref:Cullin protein neddylation domain containing protein, putative n=1 Tax=Angomonas deanei TaxID=59799 RepID=A0A7G2CMD8_9TRYP|nr:Cullin protein neddylation domain containing protein, putative [Angomonas deanei]
MNAADELAGQHKVYTIRKPAVDACIIKVMKSRRLVSHKDLVVECKKQLSTSFDPDIKIIKTSIEDLIKRDFIERDQNSEGYKYVA